MNQLEKINLLQDTIKQLRVYECKSINYISDLLKVNRKKLTEKITEWGYTPRNDKKGIKPSTQKFLNANKQYIISAFNKDVTVAELSRFFKKNESFLSAIIKYNDDIKKAFSAMQERKKNLALSRKEKTVKEEIVPLESEEWKNILGYDYLVSNMGRIQRNGKLLHPQKNVISNRLYVTLSNGDKKINAQLARLVAFCFCDGNDSVHNTVNHKDGNIENNKAENLEWVTQSDNNKHSYTELKRKHNIAKPIDYVIKYNGKYEFKTVASFSRFLGKSETQTRRYLTTPEKYNIELIRK